MHDILREPYDTREFTCVREELNLQPREQFVKFMHPFELTQNHYS